METKLEKLRGKRDSLRERAKRLDSEANEIDKAIKAHERDAFFAKANKIAKNFTGGMDEVLSILENLQSNGALPEISQSSVQDSKIENSEVEKDEAKTA